MIKLLTMMAGFLLLSLLSCTFPMPTTLSVVTINSLRQDVPIEDTQLKYVQHQFTKNIDDIDNNKYLIYVYHKYYRNKLCEYFMVAEKNGKLFYWGYLDDFKRSEDSVLQELGERISLQLIHEDEES